MSKVPHPHDTISALASAPGTAARGIVRISGPEAFGVVGRMLVTGPANLEIRQAACQPRMLRLGRLGRPLGVDVCIWPGRRSYTRQPLVELHAPGSPPILDAILAELCAHGVRPAQPGEFTLRAFLAGRIDLLQAEAVLGVIDACEERDLLSALDQMAGGASSHLVRLRGDLLDLLADLEAGLDFADEHIEFVSHPTLVGRLGLAREELCRALTQARRRLRNNARAAVVLVGPPNAGKSSLFNALLGREAAIVSSESGTTRDCLSAEVEMHSVSVRLIDTAGEQPASDAVMHEAQRRRGESIEQADLVVFCQAADVPQIAEAPRTSVPALFVTTKADLLSAVPDNVSVSAVSGIGLDELRTEIARRLSTSAADEFSVLNTTAARCEDSLCSAIAALDRALPVARREGDQELLAIEIREALDELGKIVGAVYADDLLDRIFSKFCIGK